MVICVPWEFCGRKARAIFLLRFALIAHDYREGR